MLSGSVILLTITSKFKISLQNIWRKVVGNVLINISPWNIFPTLFSPLSFHISLYTLVMLRLLSLKAQGCKDFRKPFKPCDVGIHWIALAEYSQMSSNVPGFKSFFRFLHNFVMAKLATSSIGKNWRKMFLGCQLTTLLQIFAKLNQPYWFFSRGTASLNWSSTIL